MKKFIFILVLLATILAACGSDYLIEAEHAIPGEQWGYRDTVDFRFQVADTQAVYNLYLTFDHVDTFAFQNIYLRLHTRFPDGRRTRVVRSFDFFNSLGASHGECSGHMCELRTLLQENAYFNQPGEYVLTLEQYTRRESLSGLKAVGLTVERTEKKRDQN